jgi:hypothetical protein
MANHMTIIDSKGERPICTMCREIHAARECPIIKKLNQHNKRLMKRALAVQAELAARRIARAQAG